jgi:hypothetical protein
MSVPDIRSLSAFDINKIQQSLNRFLVTQLSWRDSPKYDPDLRGGKYQWESAGNEAYAEREEFQQGDDYDIEDEYRYMVSQGFKPESMQVGGQANSEADPGTTTEEAPPEFDPQVLDTGESSNPALFINRFGGNKDTMAHSGLAAVRRAEEAGLSIRQIQQMANAQGVQFGHRAVDYINEQLGPSPQDIFADQIKAMQDMFTQSMQQQQTQYIQMQQAQDERMAALQQQMQQAMVAQQARPAVAGVKMAEGTAGTPMQIARRGVTGAFGRRGMRISALNV